MLYQFCLDLLYCTKLVLTEFMRKIVSGVDDGSNAADGDPSPANNLYPRLMQHSEGSELWNRGKTIENQKGHDS